MTRVAVIKDRIIIGAGLYGLYAALFCAKRGENVIVIEAEEKPFSRATYVNQARVHMGYHYPRSISTALKSAHYFERFVREFDFCINRSFAQVYATSAHFSWTNAQAFKKFCADAGIRCEEVPADKYFKPGMCDGAFLTEEYSYDAKQLADYFVRELSGYGNAEIEYGARIRGIERGADRYLIRTRTAEYEAPFVLNASYASVNQILGMLPDGGGELFDIKYELCEIILCTVCAGLEEVGLTVMDGPFFSIMPFGNTKYHSLTSVTFTPHHTSYQSFPEFECQKRPGALCRGAQYLGNCNECPEKPESAWKYMEYLARKYMRDDLKFSYQGSLYSMKPIKRKSELDDARPTVVRYETVSPAFVSVLSGKINTVYDLDLILEESGR